MIRLAAGKLKPEHPQLSKKIHGNRKRAQYKNVIDTEIRFLYNFSIKAAIKRSGSACLHRRKQELSAL